MSNALDLRECFAAPSLGVTSGCWAMYDLPVIEGDPTDKDLALENVSYRSIASALDDA